jgi:hypothetical protein
MVSAESRLAFLSRRYDGADRVSKADITPAY